MIWELINVVIDLYNKVFYFRFLESLLVKMILGFAKVIHFKLPAKFYYENGYQKASHKKEDNYRILNKFAVEVVMDSSLTQVIYADMEKRLNFDAVKKFNRKGWEI